MTTNLINYSQATAQKTPQKVNLTKDSKAPFDGVLLTRQALSKIISDYEYKLKKQKILFDKKLSDFKILSQHQKSKLETKLKLKIQFLEIKSKACFEQNKSYRKVLTTPLKQPWHKTPQTSLFGGLLLGYGLCLGSFYITNNVRGN